jgi:hypothetical protein
MSKEPDGTNPTLLAGKGEPGGSAPGQRPSQGLTKKASPHDKMLERLHSLTKTSEEEEGVSTGADLFLTIAANTTLGDALAKDELHKLMYKISPLWRPLITHLFEMSGECDKHMSLTLFGLGGSISLKEEEDGRFVFTDPEQRELFESSSKKLVKGFDTIQKWAISAFPIMDAGLGLNLEDRIQAANISAFLSEAAKNAGFVPLAKEDISTLKRNAVTSSQGQKSQAKDKGRQKGNRQTGAYKAPRQQNFQDPRYNPWQGPYRNPKPRKATDTCNSCHGLGHWANDPQCPNAKGSKQNQNPYQQGWPYP